MLTTYPFEGLGQADFGWLKARHHFSFGHYHNRNRMHFGVLRVINDDIVQAGRGFDTHPHNDMEIITFVRSGAITHRDSAGNEGRTEAGDVQVMSAGSGIYHSEYNLEDEDTSLYQIWIMPKERGITPRWDSARFDHQTGSDGLKLLVSGNVDDAAKGALYIHQDATIHGGRLVAGQSIIHPITHQAYLLVSDGEIDVDGKSLKKGDGAEITQQQAITITAKSAAEVIVIDVPSLA